MVAGNRKLIVLTKKNSEQFLKILKWGLIGFMMTSLFNILQRNWSKNYAKNNVFTEKFIKLVRGKMVPWKMTRKIVLRQRNAKKFERLFGGITIYLAPSFDHEFIIYRRKKLNFKPWKSKFAVFYCFFFLQFSLFLAHWFPEKALKACFWFFFCFCRANLASWACQIQRCFSILNVK